MKKYIFTFIFSVSIIFSVFSQSSRVNEEGAFSYLKRLPVYRTTLEMDQHISSAFMKGDIRSVRKISLDREKALMQCVDSVMAYIPASEKSETAASLVCRLAFNLGYESRVKILGMFAQDFAPACLVKLRQETEAESRLQVGCQASDFQLFDTAGKTYTLKNFSDKYLFIEFSASWCGWCKKELPHIQSAYQKYGDKVSFVTVYLDDKREKWQEAVETASAPWLALSDLKGMQSPVAQAYHVTGVPSCFLISPEGKIVAKGMRGEEITQEVAKAVESAEGIHFLEGTFAQALKKSQESGKFIFMDCFTSWCAPCRMMNKTVLKDPRVAAYFNENFVNIKYDMEKGEGRKLSARYGMKVFPTYLILDSEGNEIHRVVGGHDVDEFLTLVKSGTDRENSIAALKKKYQRGERSSAFLHQYIQTLGNGYCFEQIPEVLDELCRSKQEQLTAEDWKLIKRFHSDPRSYTFSYVAAHREQFHQFETSEQLEKWIYDGIYIPIYNAINNAVYDEAQYDASLLSSLRETVVKVHPDREKFLTDYLDFHDYYHVGNLKKVISIYDKKFTDVPSNEKLKISMQMNFMLYTKGSIAECQKGLKIFRKLFNPKDPLLKNFELSLQKRMDNLHQSVK